MSKEPTVNQFVNFVIPCYNEGKRFNIEYWNEISNLNNINLIFVDDGSKDNTLDLIKNIKNSRF